MNEDVSKLPKWAQQRIATLAMNLEHAKRQAFEAANTAGTNTYVQDYIHGERGLPNDTTIGFRLGPRFEDTIEVSIEREAGVTQLRIRSQGTRIVVTPYACNTVTVKGDRT